MNRAGQHATLPIRVFRPPQGAPPLRRPLQRAATTSGTSAGGAGARSRADGAAAIVQPDSPTGHSRRAHPRVLRGGSVMIPVSAPYRARNGRRGILAARTRAANRARQGTIGFLYPTGLTHEYEGRCMADRVLAPFRSLRRGTRLISTTLRGTP
jgi:hypothetical protein